MAQRYVLRQLVERDATLSVRGRRPRSMPQQTLPQTPRAMSVTQQEEQPEYSRDICSAR
jgi:hypothetical protein